ncbi:melanophilin-like [Megalops cyprinoides]|uniref:melanophilin-like n=1 Tax=Megalops cyprinoides TaxID=118141 RepID=UPI0018653D40|nr:melanophilin-like [Megalops cyprinoides]
MAANIIGKKLDLTRLTDEEAKHVWEVILRDFDLRKKEEERLGELKTKIEKEGTKRELLGSQSSLTESHCIRCLQPFKFLLNSKRQCLDCQLYTCKACSRYNKKERGWVCDPCRMSRVLKIGTLEWYHQNVRARFKRFGSAKVMRSLQKRLNGERPRDDDTHSMPDVRSVFDGHDEDQIDPSDGQRYRLMRKTKRLLSVHPLDFDLDNEYSTHSRRQSFQILEEQAGQGRDPEFNTEVHLRIHRRKSLDKSIRSDEGQYNDYRMMRARSLSKIAAPNGPQRHHYQDMDTSEEEEGQRYPLYQLPPRRRSRASSQENVHQAPPQITELNKRMSAIESLLNRLEQKMTTPPEQPVLSEAEIEEKKLRRKLDELTGNISDKGLSSEEDEVKKPPTPREPQGRGGGRGQSTPMSSSLHAMTLSSSSDELPTASPASRKVYPTASKPFHLDKKPKVLGDAKSRYSNTTDSELSELEDKVAMAAAKVQNTESEVSDIENRIAALSAAGMAVEKTKRRGSSAHQRRKASQDYPMSQADLFVRNSLYRGSLTQRNPVVKPTCKPSYAIAISA